MYISLKKMIKKEMKWGDRMDQTRTYSILKKEFYEIRRDPYTLGIAIVMPLILLLLFGYAINLDVKNISITIFDRDASSRSRTYVEKISSSGYFDLVGYVDNYAEIEELLDKGKVKAAIIIPGGFAEKLAKGMPVEVETIVDGTFPPAAEISIGYISAINEIYSASIINEILQKNGGSIELSPAVQLEERVWYNPSLESKNFIIPGLFAVILMAFPPLLSTLAIVREREKGSIQQIFVSPTRPIEFIIGKTVPYAMIAFLEMAIILVAGRFWFRVPFEGSFLLFLLLATIYVFCTVGIGVLVSTMMKSQVAAMLLVLVITVMPSLLFSGFIYPIFNMPAFFKFYTFLFPARYFIDISRDILLKGNGIVEMLPNVVMLFIYASAIITLATLRFRKNVD